MSAEPSRPVGETTDWLDLIFRHSSEAVVIGTITGIITSANSAAERLFGYGPGEMVGLVQADTIDDPERLPPAIAHGERTGSFGGELWLVRKDGTRFEGEVFTVRFDTPDGQRIWMMIHNVSALRESEQRFRALSEATFEAVIVHDAGTILFGNASAHEMYRCRDLRGRDLFDFVAPESRDLVRRSAAALETRPYEAIGRRDDGTTFAAEARARSIQYRGRMMRIVNIRDISERERLEADLAARERLATMGRLAAGVAHEVNNPLTFAMLNLEGVTKALSRGPLADDQRPPILEMLEQIRIGLDRVSRVVQDMRTFSRVEPRTVAPVQLERVIDYAARVAGPDVRPRASLEVDVPESLYVRADEARLGQVFVNLLVNAAHAIAEGEPQANRVEVRAARKDGLVEVTVHDTGCGIPESVRAHMFEPFYSTKAAGVGLGLGLSICHAIVTSLGGTIAAETPAEGGTSFCVTLPWEPEPAETPPGARSLAEPSRRWRVLIVDDEPLLRAVLGELLARRCDVVMVDSVDAALARLEGGAAFDAILSDIVMPHRSGIDFYEELSRRFPDMVRRLGFITGGALDPGIQDFLETSGRPCIHKPFAVDDVVATLRALARD
jgi:PAS domain S-box-containing protein